MTKDFDGVKVFSETKHLERNGIGDKVTAWKMEHARSIEVVETIVQQSSDQQFHCLSIVLFYKNK